MTKHFKQFVLAFAVGFLLAFLEQCAIAADEDGFRIRQNRFAESMLVVMTKDAVKVTMPLHHWTAIAKAPDWRVHMFNSNSKLRFDLSMQDWLRGGVLDKSNEALDVYEKAKKLKVLSVSDVEQQKLKLRRIVYKSLGEELGRTYHGMGDIDKKLGVDTKKLPVESYTCLYASEVGSEKVNAFLYSLDMMPPAKGFPMQYVVNLKGGRRMLRILSPSISNAKIPRVTFDLPTEGYKLAASPREVFIAVSPGAVSDMFKELDVGTPFGNHYKHFK